MGRKKFLSLTPDEVRCVLKAFDFSGKRTRGDHEHWEGWTNDTRKVVTVQLIQGEYSAGRMKTIIQNMGLSVNEFYGRDERIAKRYSGKQ